MHPFPVNSVISVISAFRSFRLLVVTVRDPRYFRLFQSFWVNLIDRHWSLEQLALSSTYFVFDLVNPALLSHKRKKKVKMEEN
jgi:hypothetical protein